MKNKMEKRFKNQSKEKRKMFCILCGNEYDEDEKNKHYRPYCKDCWDKVTK